MNYPDEHSKQSIMNEFIMVNFKLNGIKKFYGMKTKGSARNDLSMEQFEKLQNKETLKLWSKTKECYYDFRPDIRTSDLVGMSMNHSDIYCVDVDGEDGDNPTFKWENLPEILKSCPYTKSRNKKLPHFFFRMIGLDHQQLKQGGEFNNAQDNLTFCKGELLTGNAWEIKVGFVYNYTGKLPVLTTVPILQWSDVRKFVKPDEVTKFENTQKTKFNLNLSIFNLKLTPLKKRNHKNHHQNQPYQKR